LEFSITFFVTLFKEPAEVPSIIFFSSRCLSGFFGVEPSISSFYYRYLRGLRGDDPSISSFLVLSFKGLFGELLSASSFLGDLIFFSGVRNKCPIGSESPYLATIFFL
jgi:hypothetical protein